jgi:hypothetical protein
VVTKPWVHGLWEWGAWWLSLDEIVIDERAQSSHSDVARH